MDIAKPAMQPKGDYFDAGLKNQVITFQKKWNHPLADGKVGPGTRDRLVRALLERFDASVFRRLRATGDGKPIAFVSYAWSDGEKVDKVDQWLRNHGVSVLRDREEFVAGKTLHDNISTAVARADKIVVFYSKNSKTRDWPQFERAIAEQVEQHTNESVLVYVRLDDAPLPLPDSHRLAIDAVAVPLRVVGQQLLRAIAGEKLTPPVIVIDEDAPI